MSNQPQKEKTTQKKSMGFLPMCRAIARACRPIITRILPAVAESLEIMNDYISGAFGGLSILCSMEGFYQAYQDKKSGKQRKTKLMTHAVGFALNVLYTVGAFVGRFITNVGLGFIALANTIVTLYCASYVTHQARKKLKETESALTKLRANNANLDSIENEFIQQHQHCFKSKVDVAYNVGLLVSAICFTVGLVFPPMVFAGIAFLSVLTFAEIYDRNKKFALSRWITGYQKPVKGSTYSITRSLPDLSKSQNSTEISVNIDNEKSVVSTPLPKNAVTQDAHYVVSVSRHNGM